MARRALAALLVWTALFATASAQTEAVNDLPHRWLQEPSGEDFVQFYPPGAAHQAIAGSVVLTCTILLDTTAQCRASSETPTGWGFAEAAVSLSRTFRIAPPTRDGQPIAGRQIRRTIRFAMPPMSRAIDEAETPELRALLEVMPPPDLPVWDRAPNYLTVMEAYPTEARRNLVRGRGVLSCRVNADRTLNCEPLIEMPLGMGFGEAALLLSRQFRVAEQDADFITRYRSDAFLLPVNFGASLEEEPLSRYYFGAGPLTFPVLDAPAHLYPPRARAAGVRGEVSMLCTLREAPPAQCAIEREQPPEWGLGDAVLSAFEDFPMSAEDDLLPGDQVRLTIRFEPD